MRLLLDSEGKKILDVSKESERAGEVADSKLSVLQPRVEFDKQGHELCRSSLTGW